MCHFFIMVICQDAPFCHLFINFCQTFDNFLPKFVIFAKFVIVLRIANYQHAPILSSHLNIWPNIWWIFATLAIFVEICLLSIFPSLSPHLRFCQIVDGFLPNSPFSQICHFCQNRQLLICLFCCLVVSILAKLTGFAKYVIFVKPTIMDIFLNFC